MRWAAFVATATGSSICAITVWQPLVAYGWMGAGSVPVPPEWNPARDAEMSLVTTIDGVFGEHRPAGLETSVLTGNPAHVLLEVSESAQMLVVGSRGHGGFASLLLGSVSAACAEHAVCPVLVLHGTTPPPTVSGPA